MPLTYDDLTGLDRLGDLVSGAHLRVAHSTQNEDDEPRAGPAIVLRARLPLLSGAEEDGRRVKRGGRESLSEILNNTI